MPDTQKISRFAIYALIAALALLLVNKWTSFSEQYDEQLQQQLLSQNRIDPNQFEAGVSTDAGFQASQPSSSQLDDNLDEPPIDQSKINDVPPLALESKNSVAVDSNTSSRQIILESNTLRVFIDKLGGDIVEVQMLRHLDSLDADAKPLRLLEKTPLRAYTAQSGLIGDSGSNVKSARAVFSSDQEIYINKTGTAEAQLYFKDSSGVVLTKTFSLEPDSYLMSVSYEVNNQSKEQWKGVFYSQISRDNSEDPGVEGTSFGMQSYLGTATTTDDSHYKKISFKDIAEENFRYSQQGGWIAMIQHYFVSAWVPDQGKRQHYFTKKSNSGMNVIGFYSDQLEVAAGDKGVVSAGFYAGPKNQYKLANYAKYLDLTVDYGWLWWLAQPLYAILYFFYSGELHFFDSVFKVFGGIHNWGVSIILLTLVVKAAFYKLAATSYRSMAHMRRVQPKLLAVRERYANDKQAQSKAMMELYQKEKINPLGGCLPILIQMPVFIALYWALMESVELRHSSFLWLKDLSVMDPYYILPIVMGASMWFQQKMNPTPPDPMQAKVMAWMPFIFTFFFLWFPAGLVIYWVSNNVMSIAQQWIITRSIEKESASSQ